MANGVLDGMSALVTGGGGGIGGSTAKMIVRDGGAVVLMGRTVETLEAKKAAIAAEFPGSESRIQICVGDAVDADQLKGAVAQAAAMGRFTMCAAVVGMGATFSPLLAVTAAQMSSTLNGHVLPPFLAIKYATPAMVDNGGGSIVCISSTSGHMAMPYFCDYAVAKAGVEMLIRGAAEELGHLQVRVNGIRPGLTHTQDTPLWKDQEALAAFTVGKPLGRLGMPDDIGGGVRYLLGPESSWVTGQSFAIDGGHELRAYPRMVEMARRFTGEEAFAAAEAGRPIAEDAQTPSWLEG